MIPGSPESEGYDGLVAKSLQSQGAFYTLFQGCGVFSFVFLQPGSYA